MAVSSGEEDYDDDGDRRKTRTNDAHFTSTRGNGRWRHARVPDLSDRKPRPTHERGAGHTPTSSCDGLAQTTEGRWC